MWPCKHAVSVFCALVCGLLCYPVHSHPHPSSQLPAPLRPAGLSASDLASVIQALAAIRFTPGAAWLAGYLGATQHALGHASPRHVAGIMAGLGSLCSLPGANDSGGCDETSDRGTRQFLEPAWRDRALQVGCTMTTAGDKAQLQVLFKPGRIAHCRWGVARSPRLFQALPRAHISLDV